MRPPVAEVGDGRDEPEQRVGEVYPHGPLHALDTAVALRVLVDEQLAERAKQRDPQNEDDDVPDPDDGEAQDEGDQVEQGGRRRERADDLSEDLRSVRVVSEIASYDMICMR